MAITAVTQYHTFVLCSMLVTGWFALHEEAQPRLFSLKQCELSSAARHILWVGARKAIGSSLCNSNGWLDFLCGCLLTKNQMLEV